MVRFLTPLKNENLRLRLISAGILMPIGLFLIWSGGVAAALIVTLLALIMFYEWTKLTKGERHSFLYWIPQLLLATSTFFLILQANEFAALFWIGLSCVIIFAHFLFRNQDSWQALGLLYTLTFLTTLLLFRQSPELGFESMLFIFVIVWATDSFAYIAGTLIGGPKLMPSISPKKTWAGFFAALIASAIAGFLLSWFFNLAQMPILILVALYLSVAGQAGDFFESWLKRRFHAKDSGKLIPGHGGLLDRLDSLVAASLAAYLLGALRAGIAMPAAGLLLW
jgi:phosphatidate cytidylyltransferase